MNKYLFVGGYFSGQRFTVPILSKAFPTPIPQIKLPIPKESCLAINPLPAKQVHIKTESYRREIIEGNNRKFSIFVLEGMDIDTALSLIIGEDI